MSLDAVARKYVEIQAAEREIIRAFSTAGDLLSQISDYQGGDKETSENLATQLLGGIQEIQSRLLEVADNFKAVLPDGRNTYKTEAEEYAAVLHVQALEQRLAIVRAELANHNVGASQGSADEQAMQAT
ncbi:hypothetical protein CVIRNUC_000911 [Coccomyxa viridis]|uniref:Mediator of RNA polymerase II transcription subunit 11 n=1 Tax=Coccomyxa viridis TaxID=1274662 RepID=A0AAV1HSH9_9CHLO|nr:hypothetical protein CVIRNUC_000911 [Coccomyxa viridis]